MMKDKEGGGSTIGSECRPYETKKAQNQFGSQELKKQSCFSSTASEPLLPHMR